MFHQVKIESKRSFVFKEYEDLLGIDDICLVVTPDEMSEVWAFYRKQSSNTLFVIEKKGGEYSLLMDALASYDDYRIFPYMLDTLSIYLTDIPYMYNNRSAFEEYDEDRIEEMIGEEVACIKCALSLGLRYYIEFPKENKLQYVTQELLNQYGVTIYSSTSRIYGYISFLMKADLLPCSDVYENVSIGENCEDDEFVEVPQHEPIGSVRSWQTDGAETVETYSEEDVKLLLRLAVDYKEGREVHGYVLNDIGTIYENGIGVDRNVEEAIFWYKEAIIQGDNLYAPTSLGDIYRRGYDDVKPDLVLALEAYRISVDPYSWYRIGQSYEEGWIGEYDMEKANVWYEKAAKVGHHLAIKRFEEMEDN